MRAILDIRGLLLHSYYSGQDPEALLEPETGKAVNTAEYGFGVFLDRYLFPILQDLSPLNLIVVWDGGNDYRKMLHPSYKAKREKAKGEAAAQHKELWRLATEFFKGLGILQVKVPGVEADDTIAYLVKGLRAAGEKLAIYTVDKDLLVLHEHGSVAVYFRGDPNASIGDVPNNLVCLYKSIVGDSSDNYPGVSGLGEVAWQTMFDEFGADGMEEIEDCVVSQNFKPIEEALQLTQNRALAKLYAERNSWILQYRLAKLHPELVNSNGGDKFIRPEWTKRAPSAERVIEVLNRVGLYVNEQIPVVLRQYMPVSTLITADNDTETFFAEFKELLYSYSPFVSFDYESFDALKHEPFQTASKKEFVDVLSQQITGVSFTLGPNANRTYYISVGHLNTNNVDKSLITRLLSEIDKSDVTLVAHNAQFEVILSAFNLDFIPSVAPLDTTIFSSYSDENLISHLKSLSLHWLNYKQTTYDEVIAGRSGMNELTAQEVFNYGTDDAICTAALFHLFTLITKLNGSYDFILNHERDVLWPLADSFVDGVRVDRKFIAQADENDRKAIKEGRERIRELLAEHCSQPNQAAAVILFNELWAFKKAKLEADKTTEEQMTAKRDELWAETYLGTQYRPLVKVVEERDVKVTPATLLKVALALEMDVPKPGGVTVNKLNEWVAICHNYIEHDPRNHMHPDRLEFVNALSAAADSIKKKAGYEYDALIEILKRYSEPRKEVVSGTFLNFGSSPQMQHLLYGMLGLPIRSKTKVDRGSVRDKLGLEGGPSTDEDAITLAIAEDTEEGDWKREVLQQVIAVNKAGTRVELYWEPYPKWVHPLDGYVHASIKNCGTVTRRPTGSAPNLLQIDKHSPAKVRRMILPHKEDHVIVSVDFAGQELRILASESGDPTLLDAYLSNPSKDVHSVTGAGLTSLLMPRIYPEYGRAIDYAEFTAARKELGPLQEAVDKIRDEFAKPTNFLIVYGGGPGTLSRNTGIKLELSKQIIQQWFQTYPGVAEFTERVLSFARQHGYVLTAYGNPRHAQNEFLSADRGISGRWGRKLVNSIIQGTAADILKIVLSRAHRTGLFRDTQSVMIAPVYDEIASSVPIPAVLEYCFRLKELMSLTPPGHQIAMVPEFSVGKNWADLIKLGTDLEEGAIMSALSKCMVE